MSRIRTKGMLISSMYSHMKQACVKRSMEQPSFTRKELFKWCNKQNKFHDLYAKWVEGGCKTDDIPSIDRIDDYKTYTFDNIQLMTFKENREKMYKDKRDGKNTKVSKAVQQLSTTGKVIAVYHSTGTASRATGIARNGISRCCNGRSKTAGGYRWKFL